ncbi:metal-dependent phosphohydrolase [Chitinivibrio alkaliphilus]|uniref:Metal dependent phosphohydrolase n=1 Tax=Chitinivibrio alkaliphilus ACht1 TaxID=1313304 RepID=U7DA16_9BACT|nr:metal-dependent phosphohydrolase [Chitinivibrio alkaliphilus]ERP31942.1 Metal dependent phosphohydrolase [Chitinivibrio alkaliphilus ACht1]
MNTRIQKIFEKYYNTHSKAYHYVTLHSKAVCDFCIPIAHAHGAEVSLVESGSFLHDIGAIFCDAPSMGCFGTRPYIQHGVEGQKLLEQEGIFYEAKIALTHVGVSISVQDIIDQNLPLPQQDMTPTTLEEKIIAYGDLFFSKRPAYLTTPKSIERVRYEVSRYGIRAREIFETWHEQFYIP